jgi:hypothetical protein
MTHTEQLEQLYVFAVYMLGSRDEAFAAVCDVTARHPGAPERWLEALVRPFLVYSRIAETKSNDEMQAYFARLLAGEIRKPGSFSPATVEVLSRLTPDLANMFHRLCNISSTIYVPGARSSTINAGPVAVIASPYGSPGANALQPLGFAYVDLCELQDAGLLQSSITSRWSPTVSTFAMAIIACAGRPLRFQMPMQPEKVAMDAKINLQSVLFTRAGREIRRLMELTPNKEYLKKLQEWLTKELKPYGLTGFSEDVASKSSIE